MDTITQNIIQIITEALTGGKVTVIGKGVLLVMMLGFGFYLKHLWNQFKKKTADQASEQQSENAQNQADVDAPKLGEDFNKAQEEIDDILAEKVLQEDGTSKDSGNIQP